jgi:hypothetical protein
MDETRKKSVHRKLSRASMEETRKKSEHYKLSRASMEETRKKSERRKLSRASMDETRKIAHKRKLSRSGHEQTRKHKLRRILWRRKVRGTAKVQAQRRESIANLREAKSQKLSESSKEKARIQYARACRQHEVVSDQGSWRTAATIIAHAEGTELPGCASIMPPSFVALNNDACLSHVQEMYDFLQKASWQTCVVCWRAWYTVDFSFGFARSCGRRGENHRWYKPGESVILGARRKKY